MDLMTRLEKNIIRGGRNNLIYGIIVSVLLNFPQKQQNSNSRNTQYCEIKKPLVPRVSRHQII